MKKSINNIGLKTCTLSLLVSLLIVGESFAQQRGSELIMQPQEAKQFAENRNRLRLQSNELVNNPEATQTTLIFTATPRSDLPAFNFSAITTDSPCSQSCEFEWVINQNTKVLSKGSKVISISSLKPDTNYFVEWIKADAQNARLISEIKLLK